MRRFEREKYTQALKGGSTFIIPYTDNMQKPPKIPDSSRRSY